MTEMVTWAGPLSPASLCIVHRPVTRGPQLYVICNYRHYIYIVYISVYIYKHVAHLYILLFILLRKAKQNELEILFLFLFCSFYHFYCNPLILNDAANSATI